MKVIFIAAGYGSRLKQDMPKPLVEVNGLSILERQISLFQQYGINDIIIIVGPEKEKFNLKNVTYIHDVDFDEHEQLGSLMAAKDFLKGKILTCYSDILFDEEILKEILNFSGDIGIPIDLDWRKNYIGRTQHPKSEADNVVLNQKTILKIQKNISFCHSNEVIGEFLGPIIFSENGSKIFVEKYNKLKNIHHGNFHNAPSLKKAYLTDMIQELLDNDIQIDPILINGKWCEIDTFEDLKKAELLFN